VVSAKSRTSSPRLDVIWRSALAWFQAEISRMPAAARQVEAELRAERRSPPGRADVERHSPPSRCGGSGRARRGVGDGGLGAAPP
jgi:hypothetical protein